MNITFILVLVAVGFVGGIIGLMLSRFVAPSTARHGFEYARAGFVFILLVMICLAASGKLTEEITYQNFRTWADALFVVLTFIAALCVPICFLNDEERSN